MDFNTSKKDVDTLYKDLIPIAQDIVLKSSGHIDEIMKKIKKEYSNLTNRQISEYMLQLGAEAYFFGMKKDYASLKKECAEVLYKENHAISYQSSEEKTASAKNTQATLDNTSREAVRVLYDVVSSLMKTKLDEMHRMINVLNSVMISRNAEAKLKPQNDYDSQID